MIQIARLQCTNDVPEPGHSQTSTRYMKATKERSIVFDGGLVFVTDEKGQTIIPLANVDFMVPVEAVEPKKR